jgi:hypothetical protein
MVDAVRYLLDHGASVDVKGEDGYLPIQWVLSFAPEHQREMLYSLTEEDSDLFSALTVPGFSGLALPDYLTKPLSVFAAALYLRNTNILDAIDELAGKLFSNTPTALQGLWFQGLRLASSLNLPSLIRRYLALLGHFSDQHLSIAIQAALEIEVVDRVLYHGTCYRQALKDSLELLLTHAPVLSNSAGCHFYHTALNRGHFDILPFLWKHSEALKFRGLELSVTFCPRRASAAAFIAADQFTLAERALQIFNLRLRAFPDSVDHIDRSPIDLSSYPEAAFLLLRSLITDRQKLAVLDKLFDHGWKPEPGGCFQVLAILVRSSGTNYKNSIGNSIEPMGDLNIQQRRIVYKMLESRKNDQALLFGLFELMALSTASFKKLTLFLAAARDIGVNLDALFDSFTSKQHKRNTIFHELAEAIRSPTRSNSWGIRELTKLYGKYFSGPHHLLSVDELDASALHMGILLSNYEFVKPFIEILQGLGPQMPSGRAISRLRFLLEYTEIEKCRTNYNQSLSFYRTEEDVTLDAVGGEALNIERSRAEYLLLRLRLTDLARIQRSQAGTPSRDYRSETQGFIDAIVNLDMDHIMNLQIVGFHVWEVPNYEPTMAHLVGKFDYLSVLLEVLDGLLQRSRLGDTFPVMSSFALQLAGDLDSSEAVLAEELGPSAFLAMLYILGGTDLIIDNTASSSEHQTGHFEFKGLSTARQNLGKLHNLFRHDLIDLNLPVPPKYPSYPIAFNGRVWILSELLRRYGPVIKDESAIFPYGDSSEAFSFRGEIWQEMDLCWSGTHPAQQNMGGKEQGRRRLQSLIGRILTSFTTCDFKISMAPGSVDVKNWLDRMILLCCLRRLQLTEAQTRSTCYPPLLRMRERSSRRAVQRLDIFHGKPDHFINQCFVAVLRNTERVSLSITRER